MRCQVDPPSPLACFARLIRADYKNMLLYLHMLDLNYCMDSEILSGKGIELKRSYKYITTRKHAILLPSNISNPMKASISVRSIICHRRN